MNATLLIMAAGMGSRYGGLKQLESFGKSGETLLEFSIYDALKAGFSKIIFVIRPEIENEIKEKIGNKLPPNIPVSFIYQTIPHVPEGVCVEISKREKPWGTGHAIWCARNIINGPFAVINADDFYGFEAYAALINFFSSNTNQQNMALVGYQLNNTLSPYGSVSRGVCEVNKNAHLTKITEYTKVKKTGDQISSLSTDKNTLFNGDELTSMNCWGLYPSFLNFLENELITFINKNAKNPQDECYIPEVVNSYMSASTNHTVEVIKCKETWFGITYLEDKELVINRIQQLYKIDQYPENLWT